MPSATPILDLEREYRIVDPEDLTWQQGMLLLVLTFAGTIGLILSVQIPAVAGLARVIEHTVGKVTSDNPLEGLLLLALGWFLAVAIHEAAHAGVGHWMGFRIQRLSVGPVTMQFSPLRLDLTRTDGVSGLVSARMARWLPRLRRRLIAFTVAGVAANGLTAIVCFSCLHLIPVGSFVWKLVALLLTFSALLVVTESLPVVYRGWHSDGAGLAMLLFSRAKTTRRIAQLALDMQQLQGRPLRSRRRTWLRRATSFMDDSRVAAFGCLMGYLIESSSKNEQEAARYLELCLEKASFGGKSFAQMIVAEAACFQAFTRNDDEKAKQWLQHLKNREHLSGLVRVRLEITEAWLKRDRSALFDAFKRGNLFIEQMPDSPETELFKASWKQWYDEITKVPEASATAKTV